MIKFIRLKNTPFGGAENYLGRLTKVLKERNITFETIHSSVPKFLPSWFKALYFNLEVCLFKTDFYFSLERIGCADIYRAGDGVHRVFLESKKQQLGKLSLNPLNPVYLYLEKRCFLNSKHIIANSKMIKQQIIDSYAIDSDKISVIYNGIEFKKHNKQVSKQQIKSEFNFPEQSRILLYVGSGFQRKGVAEFLKTFAQLKHKNCVAFILGKEKRLSKYLNLAKELGIHNRVYFTGPRKDVDTFYSASDIFLFPTHYEPFSNVVLEAASFHNVVFTTRQNGANEILPDDNILSSPSDNVSEKIDVLLENEIDLIKAQETHFQIAQQYSIEKNVEKTLKIIEKLNGKA